MSEWLKSNYATSQEILIQDKALEMCALPINNITVPPLVPKVRHLSGTVNNLHIKFVVVHVGVPSRHPTGMIDYWTEASGGGGGGGWGLLKF